MTLNFYTLGVLYLVYSFLGWVGETVVATFRGKRFANRGMAAGPFCFVYGTTAILMAVGFADLRTKPVVLFVACMLTATVVEWLTAKLLERLHNRKWWDYSDKKFNLNGYVCLQYSVLWGALGMVTVLWGNGLLLRLCALVPDWLLHPLVWAALGIAALDQLGSAVLVGRYAAQHPVLEQLNQKLEARSDTLRRRIAVYVEKRIQRAYPEAARQQPTAVQKGQADFLSAADLLWLFVIGAFLGDMVETVFCRLTAGVWMSRSSLVWGPFSVVWGLALVMAAVLLRGSEERSDRSIFLFGFVMGGAYEYICSAVGELLFGVIFSIGWTPCVGAFLGSALMLASQQASVAQGVILLLCYSAGLGIPFVAAAVLIDKLKGAFAVIKQHYDIINKVCGWFLVAVGVLMATGLLGGFLRLLS